MWCSTVPKKPILLRWCMLWIYVAGHNRLRASDPAVRLQVKVSKLKLGASGDQLPTLDRALRLHLHHPAPNPQVQTLNSNWWSLDFLLVFFVTGLVFFPPSLGFVPLVLTVFIASARFREFCIDSISFIKKFTLRQLLQPKASSALTTSAKLLMLNKKNTVNCNFSITAY